MCLSSVAALEIQLHTQQLKAKIVGRLQLFVGTPLQFFCSLRLHSVSHHFHCFSRSTQEA
jgi:hypothetical protein